jgi:hypothetical protein
LAAHKIQGPSPNIDGLLTDNVWRAASQFSEPLLLQLEPDEGQRATESTLVAVAYDEQALYIAFWCYDSNAGEISQILARRDRHTQADAVSVHLDPFHDHHSGYSFHVNASNVQRDLRAYNDEDADLSWDGVWQSAVRVEPWGWSAELKIPYECLRFDEMEDMTWGLQFIRYISRKTEEIYWSFSPSKEAGFVSRFGHLNGLREIHPSVHIEVLPYVMGRLNNDPTAANTGPRNELFENTGLDVKYGLTTDLTLDVTLNPDFGQVELDRPVLNLSAYETQYSEKRPFFLEGSELYRMEYTPFYSRRIGRPPQHHVADPYLAYYTDYPSVTTILGAAKLTGRISRKTSVAILAAITGEETAKYDAIIPTLDTVVQNGVPLIDTVRLDTIGREGVVEPAAAYSVARVQQTIMGNSWIGSIVTLASQGSHRPVATGGLDWRLLTHDRSWSFHGQTVVSKADTGAAGFGVDAVIEKEAGKHWRATTGIIFKDPRLDLNRLGYLNRNDYRESWVWLEYRTSEDWWVVRNSWHSLHTGGSWTWSGLNLNRHVNWNSSIQYTNNWVSRVGGHYYFGDYDDLETRGRMPWRVPESWNAWLEVRTDNRKKGLLDAGLYFGDSRTSPWWAGRLYASYRPQPNLEFWIEGVFTRDFGQLMWIDNPDEHTTLFATKDQDIFDLAASGSVLLTPNLSLQLSATGLVSGLDFQNLRDYLGGHTYEPFTSATDYHYLYRALNSMLLLRWEYRPGSTIYLVWTRMREEVDPSLRRLSLWRDLGKLFAGEGKNVVLIKASYWWSP